MKTVDTHGTFDEAIEESSNTVQALAVSLRDLILEVYPDAVEVPWPTQKIIGYGVGPKKMSEHFCYIAALNNYANLGFYYGTNLPDPAGLLEGTGQNLRHVKIRDISMIGNPEIRKLLERSVQERQTALSSEDE